MNTLSYDDKFKQMETKDRGSYTYFLNWMGPISKAWCEKNGNHWCVGRIDVGGVPDEPYGIEYAVPLMHEADWAALGDFLHTLDRGDVDCLYTKEELFEMFEALHGKIRWFESNEEY